jgi:hypothetical protein
VDLSEQKASVFWGIIQARGEDDSVKELLIGQQANKERNKVGLEPLTEKEIVKSLHVLKLLKCVEPVADQPGN